MYDYHIHLYYDMSTRSVAKLLRNNLHTMLEGVAKVSLLHDKPPYPHPQPMFEIAFPKDLLPKLTQWFKTHRNGLSVLLHPVQSSETDAYHSKGRWMGQPLTSG
ncbi:Aromatic ring-cleaving dioxygenase [Piscirickettsia salmonis]|uniref:DOPA 4,5-dioxygenase family protein n=1 Tax=Piscirickettsia salmonis TaxID=1238 RepID=UPI0012B74C6C|nr:DOPA 4,5-dioxygenase family protein [Piscirickettsia salmonis]QGP51301.1 Aromatic ring-cleaving dioxygenase [Piscirickettsia salmonis]QGP53485.1 Aromatic ring-cleaving dioxygenase [Piscirickettsia salmonis]QGP60596.1 Aromatic ring-cleaving dioxygenase [Piscirickettsia salmonis]QGP63053.1 Aromatic ring-cleaving dioxygenase [Piscirickettsia salmonis]